MTTNMHMMTRLQKRLREEEEEEDIAYADAMREMLQRASIDVKLQILRHVMHDGSNSNEKMFLCLKLLGLMDDSVFALDESVLRSVFDLAFCVRYGVCRLYLNFIRKSGHTGMFADFEMMDRMCAGWRSVSLSGHSDRVPSACFSPDGSKIVTASADETAKIWYVKRYQMK